MLIYIIMLFLRTNVSQKTPLEIKTQTENTFIKVYLKKVNT